MWPWAPITVAIVLKAQLPASPRGAGYEIESTLARKLTEIFSYAAGVTRHYLANMQTLKTGDISP